MRNSTVVRFTSATAECLRELCKTCLYLSIHNCVCMLSLQNEESFILARSWVGMRHAGAGDTVRRGDSVLLRAGARRSEPPFVARVSQLWENPTDGKSPKPSYKNI